MQRFRAAALCAWLGSVTSPVWPQTPSGPPAPAVEESITVEEAAPDAVDTARDTSSSVTVIEVDPGTHGLTPLSEILSRQAGLEVRRYGGLGSFSTLSIRGSSPSQVTIYLDGVPVSGGDSGRVNIDDFPVGGLERIEVYRGVAPGRFSSGGIGGVVNLVTRRAGAGLSLSAEAGQYATMGGRVAAGLNAGRLSGHATLHALRSDGDFRFLDDNGTPLNSEDDARVERLNNRFDQFDGLLRAEFHAARRLHLELSAEAFDKAQGVPGLGANQAEQTSFSSRRLTLSLGARLDGFLLQGGTLQGAVHGALRQEHYQDPAGEVGVGVQDEQGRFRSAGGRLHVLLPLGGGAHRISALAELQREDHSLEDRLRPGSLDSSRWSLSLVLEDPALFGQGAWELTPRLRLQRFQSDFKKPGTPGDPVEPLPEPGLTAISPSLGLRRIGQSFELRANAGRSVRVPSFSELFGDRGTVVGNVTLRPETGWNADLGASLGRPLWDGRLQRLEAAVFASFVDELVVYVQNSQQTFQPFNIGRARTIGLELSALGRLGPAEIALACTLQDARDRSDVTYLRGNELPGRSRQHSSAELRLPRGPLRLGTSLELLSANFLDRANLQRAGARFYQGLSLAAGGRGGWPELSVDLKNLWDEQTADVGGFPLPGRSVFLGLRWQFAPDDKD